MRKNKNDGYLQQNKACALMEKRWKYTIYEMHKYAIISVSKKEKECIQ